MSVVLEIPMKQKTEEICESSGNIWDRCKCPSTLNSMQIKEIEDAWSSIPKKYTDGITNVIIDHVQEDIGGGWYEGGSGIVADIYIANGSVVGSASTLHHEVHHHMWSIKRSYLKKKNQKRSSKTNE